MGTVIWTPTDTSTWPLTANWWVTVVDAPSGDAAIANGWCDMHNIDSWNCFAKYVSDRVGPDGTTVIRR